MRFFESVTTTFAYLTSPLTFSPSERPGLEGKNSLPAFNYQPSNPNDPVWKPVNALAASQEAVGQARISAREAMTGGPIFKPPSGSQEGPGSTFLCDYSNMPGFQSCSNSTNRGCWLTNNNGKQYDINTNYEDINETPIGIHRNYTLTVTDSWVNADGMNFTDAKLFNDSYPGPWIQGCWGDVRATASFLHFICLPCYQTITVIVNNELKHNGTSIHWHGIRQWLNMQMDGVNGITQCPIAPGDSFNYTFRAMQYGSSWYHSHFSVQYSDGVIGPLVSLHAIKYDVRFGFCEVSAGSMLGIVCC